MPITKDEFERGEARNTVAAAIREFLQKNPDNAYTTNELFTAIQPGRHMDIADTLKMGTALMILTFDGSVEQKYITRQSEMGEWYYRTKKKVL